MNVRKYLELAAQVSRLKEDDRNFYHGAVGLRRDGVLVAAQNGAPPIPTPEHHCEFRITRKLGRDGIIFLVRTLADGSWGDSTPCPHCQARLIRKKVKKIYFSIGKNNYAVWYPSRTKPVEVEYSK